MSPREFPRCVGGVTSLGCPAVTSNPTPVLIGNQKSPQGQRPRQGQSAKGTLEPARVPQLRRDFFKKTLCHRDAAANAWSQASDLSLAWRLQEIKGGLIQASVTGPDERHPCPDEPILCKCRSTPGNSANLVLSLKSKTKHDCMLCAVYLTTFLRSRLKRLQSCRETHLPVPLPSIFSAQPVSRYS